MAKIEQVKTDKFSFLTFENIYNESELELIWKEIKFLNSNNKLSDPLDTGAALSDDNLPKKSNKGVFLDHFYSNRNFSNYLSLYKKPFDSVHEYVTNDYTLNLFNHTNFDTTLLSYYEDGDYYLPHYDNCVYTYLFWIFEEPKKFTGGDLVFSDVDYRITVKNNMAVLFPSWAVHGVEKCIGNGRYSFASFFYIK